MNKDGGIKKLLKYSLENILESEIGNHLANERLLETVNLPLTELLRKDI